MVVHSSVKFGGADVCLCSCHCVIVAACGKKLQLPLPRACLIRQRLATNIEYSSALYHLVYMILCTCLPIISDKLLTPQELTYFGSSSPSRQAFRILIRTRSRKPHLLYTTAHFALHSLLSMKRLHDHLLSAETWCHTVSFALGVGRV
jgi:hypothetical protein